MESLDQHQKSIKFVFGRTFSYRPRNRKHLFIYSVRGAWPDILEIVSAIESLNANKVPRSENIQLALLKADLMENAQFLYHLIKRIGLIKFYHLNSTYRGYHYYRRKAT